MSVILDKVISTINYRTNSKLFNIYFSNQANNPNRLWPLGCSVDHIDNEAFYFLSPRVILFEVLTKRLISQENCI